MVATLWLLVDSGRLSPWPVALAMALGIWWNANTIAHVQIHRPIFVSAWLNRRFTDLLTLTTGIPQSIWRARHLWHHAGEPADKPPRPAPAELRREALLLCGLLILLGLQAPAALLSLALPAYALGLLLCSLQGHFEHAGGHPARPGAGGVSCYHRLYNRLWLNDGYHAEHHRWPAEHWRRLPLRRLPDAPTSAFPPVFRWLEVLRTDPRARAATGLELASGSSRRAWMPDLLDRLERACLKSPRLQGWVLRCHARALDKLAPLLPDRPRRILVIGGGIFPRSGLLAAARWPAAQIRLLDQNTGNLALARLHLELRLPAGDLARVECRTADWKPAEAADCDIVFVPLGFRGNREAFYRSPPADCTVVHDWIWRPRGSAGCIVSILLLKRLNIVEAAG